MATLAIGSQCRRERDQDGSWYFRQPVEGTNDLIVHIGVDWKDKVPSRGIVDRIGQSRERLVIWRATDADLSREIHLFAIDGFDPLPGDPLQIDWKLSKLSRLDIAQLRAGKAKGMLVGGERPGVGIGFALPFDRGDHLVSQPFEEDSRWVAANLGGNFVRQVVGEEELLQLIHQQEVMPLQNLLRRRPQNRTTLQVGGAFRTK